VPVLRSGWAIADGGKGAGKGALIGGIAGAALVREIRRPTRPRTTVARSRRRLCREGAARASGATVPRTTGSYGNGMRATARTKVSIDRRHTHGAYAGAGTVRRWTGRGSLDRKVATA